jgi:pimeloyl-ACP methyl ester carboxylesterase
MKKLLFSLLSLPFLVIFPLPALANTTSLSFDPAYASGPFQFFCQPYLRSFEEGKHYISTLLYPMCEFSIPATVSALGIPNIAIYKGVPGNAKMLSGDRVFSTPTLVSLDHSTFTDVDADGNLIAPKQDYDFFAVVYIDSGWDVAHALPSSGASAESYQLIKFKWGAKPASEWEPVVIIPGILGSWEKNGQWILDPMAHVYDNLIDTLKANGYVENQNLFSFPYDWEKSNVDTAKLLAQKISQIKTTCGCSKVDLVAHSMGGLVATQYIESDDYKDDVDQLIMLGTPMAGSPKVYKAWEAGEMDFNDVFTNTFLQRIFDREAADGGYTSVFNYIHQKPIPSIQELLPIFQNYLKLGTAILQFPTGYPSNPFLQNLVGDPSFYGEKVLGKVQTYVVVGNTGVASTTVRYVVKNSTTLPLWQEGEVVSAVNGEGDGSVPTFSALYFSGPEKELSGVEHRQIPSEGSSYVFTTLTGQELGVSVNKKYTGLNVDWSLAASKIAPSPSDFSTLVQTIKDAFLSDVVGHTLLFIMLFSPVDVKITAPDGKQLGKDFSSGNNLTQIPNAAYSGPIGEHEYILIQDPLPGQYKVETIGTGNGAFTIASGRIDAATTTTSVVSGSTTLNQIISNTLFLSSTSTSITLTPPPPLIATSTPTTTPLTPDTCVSDITQAYQSKWIIKKAIYDNLIFDCKALKEAFKVRDLAKTNLAKNLAIAAIKLILSDMDFLAKDKSNTKNAVSLITKYTSWFRVHL